MTVEQYFEAEKIDLQFIDDNFDWCDRADYWSRAYEFLETNWGRDIGTLSQSQYNWLSRILDDCIEKRIYNQRGRR